ncbi:MAG: Gfo/Idh/MocA family oxidoreductase [Balneolales bacterium]
MSKSFNRRDFLKLSGLAGLAGTGLLSCRTSDTDNRNVFAHDHDQRFNMHRYAAPALDTVRVGVIGLGSRGKGNTSRLARIEGVEIRALCDLVPEEVDRTVEQLDGLPGYSRSAARYSGHEDEWKKLCERDDIDLVVINTPWRLHAPQLIYSMEQGKHAATEVPAAQTVDECWKLVETSERTRKHCFQMTNVTYSFFEMVTLNMARQGFFGEIIHGEGAYIHQLMTHNFNRSGYQNMWRYRENATRNGNLYPHHGIGTVSQIMDINHGDQMDFMVSVSSADFMMQERTRELAQSDPFFEDFVDNEFRGNMNTSIIRTQRGRTIMLQHDVTSPRPYSRIHLVSGTKGIARTYPTPQIATGHDGWLSEDEFNEVQEQYTPEITRKMGEMARQVGGHGGMDAMLAWRLIDCLRNGLPLDLTVYDAALWSSIIPLSEWSVANQGMPVHFPDFTSGSWKTNERAMDINLQQGGTTRIL